MKTQIICEIGSNWESLDDIFHSCEWAVNHSCLPKLQAWVTDLVVNKDRNPQIYENMSRYELPHDWIKKINKRFPQTFYSVFDLETLAFLETEIKPNYYKIASPDAVYKPLVQAIASTGIDTIVSVGGCTLNEIRGAAKAFDWRKLTLMECNTSYPAKFAYLGNLRDRIIGSKLISWGYSDHTANWVIPAFAVTLGATMIETHFKLKFFDTPDSKHSLDKEAFESMLLLIEQAEENIGTLEHPYPDEIENMELGRRKEDGLR